MHSVVLMLTCAVSVAHTREIGNKWAAAWSQVETTVWTDLYADDATYTDYAFGFIRRGKEGLRQHFNIWRKSNPDFRMEVIEAYPGFVFRRSSLAEPGKPNLMKCSIRTKNTGTFTNGLPIMKASGKPFEFYAVVDFVVRVDNGKIVAVEEWYHKVSAVHYNGHHDGLQDGLTGVLKC